MNLKKLKYKYIKEKSDEWLLEARHERYVAIYNIIDHLDNNLTLTEINCLEKQLRYWHKLILTQW